MTGGAPTLPGEIESLERFIQPCQNKLGRTPYLHRDNARKLLEEVAYRWRDGPGAATIVELIAASGLLDWSPERGDAERRAIITQLIGGSGIVVAEDGDFRFVCQTVQEYLAARHIVRRHPRGPRWWQPRTWKYLAPQTTRNSPWPDAGVMLFLAALWWREAKPAVDRRLRRLLRDRYRDLNIDFVIELIRRDGSGSDIRDHTVNLLRGELADDRQDDDRWVATAKRLYLLDPAELEKVIQYPVKTITPRRRLAAVNEITKHNPARGEKNLTNLAHSLTVTGTPQDWLSTAVQIGNLDPGVGKQTMLRLADTPNMGELRVNAAIHVSSPPLLCKLIDERDLSDKGRLDLSAVLLGLDLAMAVAAMERFAQTAREDDTPLQIANMIQPHDQPVALRIANKVAWPENKKGNSSVRLSAVIWIGKIDPAQAIPQLHRLSKAPFVTDEDQFSAAMRIITKHDGLITALVDLGNDPKRGRTYRVKIAESVGKLESATGAQLYISIAKTCTPTDRSRLTLLRKAYKLAPGPAADTLVEVAQNTRIPGPIRCEAVEIATLGTQRTIDLYTTITKTTDDDTALVAARKVMAMDQDAGQRLMGELADRSNAATKFRLTAAVEARTYGVPALTKLAYTAQSDTVQLEAAQALWPIDRKKAEPVLQKLVKKHWAGNVRIDAALTLPGTLAVEALITIVDDRREVETIRVDAGVKAKEIDEKRGRQALLDLANARGISKETREKVHRHL